MKYYALLISCFGLMSCSYTPNTDTKTRTCNIIFKPLVKHNEHDFYVSVKGFNPTNKGCWELMRTYTLDLPMGQAHVIHFMDVESFTPPSDGKMYGSEAIRKKVVAQLIYRIDGKTDFAADPFGYGIYILPH